MVHFRRELMAKLIKSTNRLKSHLQWLMAIVLVLTFKTMNAQQNPAAAESTSSKLSADAMVRIAEIEIDPSALTEYNAILKEESAKSIQVEPGVIAIFPMSVKENPTQIRIVEIYASRAAYQSHLLTPHFLHYKSATSKMVKSLKLVEMEVLDKETMSAIFSKLK